VDKEGRPLGRHFGRDIADFADLFPDDILAPEQPAPAIARRRA
jgi:hypothetical protein